ncbi:MAG TPA: SMC family ATPase, partial [Trichocoleus sp.]
MIPRQLTLKNFLSYRDATLDFKGLHVACISGPNGAGKSSLLEAIAWAVWGHSRAASEDDVIHLGELEARVDFTFEHNRQIYRILRTRRRNQASALEFQVQTESGFSVLTLRGIRATQQLICQHLKLDYDTFVNSAYLRQGRADEFMLKRPSDRKQILADLLKLEQYDELAERAKERMRQGKAHIDVLRAQKTDLEAQLLLRSQVAQSHQSLKTLLDNLNQGQQSLQQRLEQLHSQGQQRQIWHQQLQLQRQQQGHLQQGLDRLQTEHTRLTEQLQRIDEVLGQADAIAVYTQRLAQLQAQDQVLSAQFQQYQELQQKHTQLDQQYQKQQRQLSDRLRQLQHQQSVLTEQLQECGPVLAKAVNVQQALEQLKGAKERLHHLDDLQLQVAPLLQRRQTLQSELERTQTRLNTRLEELCASEQQLLQQQSKQPRLMQAVMEVAQTLEHLEKRRAYQALVREKGLERRSFMERLQANQRTYEAQLAQVDQKIRLLSEPNALCPLCDRPLDQHHWQLVLERQRVQQQDLQDQLWVIREQLTTSEREIQVLRQEYRDLEAELDRYSPTLQQRGHLEAQLSSSADVRSRLQQLEAERQQLEHCLHDNQFALDVQQELAQIDGTLAQLRYDDRDHALARGQVDRLRWAEIKQAEIDQTLRRRQRLLAQQPALETQIKAVETELEALEQSSLRHAIADLEQQLTASGYSFEAHQKLRLEIQALQPWQLRLQELEQARQQQPDLAQRVADLTELIQTRCQELKVLAQQIAQIEASLAQTPDPQTQTQELEGQLQAQQVQRDYTLAQLGALQQQLQQLDQLQAQLLSQEQSLQTAQQQVRIYQELAYAFGRNGIQALMIENLLPQLEAETNHLLSRLSSNQLHVQFVTQRASRRQDKLIDTLDILIADTRGTRPYETYSGGEAFRVNFAIRLALARLLAQRSGMPLQMLIIDEGFGTQDLEGCQNLISAISAIASDFACILTVTHIPHFREAFETRIDVVKTEDG